MTCCAKQLPQISEYSIKMVRFDILNIHSRVIWNPMRVFVGKQGVIMIHWDSVGVPERSLGLNDGSSELRGAQWSYLGLNRDHWAFLPLSGFHSGTLRHGGGHWDTVGLGGGYWSSLGVRGGSLDLSGAYWGSTGLSRGQWNLVLSKAVRRNNLGSDISNRIWMYLLQFIHSC